MNATVGDLAGNAELIERDLRWADTQQADVALFPELALPGYPPVDLLERSPFLNALRQAEDRLVARIPPGLTAVFGTVCRESLPDAGPILRNAAVVARDGRVQQRISKTLLPTYDVFDEARYFEPAEPEQDPTFLVGETRVGVTLCEDIWNVDFSSAGRNVDGRGRRYRRDPVAELMAKQAPKVVFNLSASPWSLGKEAVRLQIAQAISRRHGVVTVYCNMIGGNDGLLFDGNSLAVGSDGSLRWSGPGFETHRQILDLTELEASPSKAVVSSQPPAAQIRAALVMGIRDYFEKLDLGLAIIGLSGGIDSAVTAVLAVEALGAERVRALAMPGPYSSEGSVADALQLAQNLGISCPVVPIDPVFSAFRSTLDPLFRDLPEDVTEENLQSRIRGTLLMAAANKFSGVVLNTGNKAEAAMGYATLYGDAIGALSVLGDLYKHQVYAVAECINADAPVIPRSTIEKPPSAELKPGQKDEDSLPPYSRLDAVLQAFLEERESVPDIARRLGVDEAEVQRVVEAVYRSEFKRKQLPPTLRVSKKAWIGRRYPIVMRFREE